MSSSALKSVSEVYINLTVASGAGLFVLAVFSCPHLWTLKVTVTHCKVARDTEWTFKSAVTHCEVARDTEWTFKSAVARDAEWTFKSAVTGCEVVRHRMDL